MKPLIALLSAFIVTSALFKLASDSWHTSVTGNFALSFMLFFTALGHFKFTGGMALMLPEPVPLKKAIIYLTGLLELALAVGFIFPQYRLVCGIIFIVFLLLALPANIRSAFLNVNYETADYSGKGPAYLWFRVPMQLFLLVWTFYFAVRAHLLHCYYFDAV